MKNIAIDYLRVASNYAVKVEQITDILLDLRITCAGIEIKGTFDMEDADSTGMIKTSVRTISWGCLTTCSVNPVRVEIDRIVEDLKPV